jgi:hypothetical protein
MTVPTPGIQSKVKDSPLLSCLRAENTSPSRAICVIEAIRSSRVAFCSKLLVKVLPSSAPLTSRSITPCTRRGPLDSSTALAEFILPGR